MLLLCESSVVDRRVKAAPIPYPSQITLVDEFVNLKKELFLQITKTVNGQRSEERYQLLNNVAKLDTHLVKDNILLISLHKPKYNIFIKCGKAQLNSFVKSMKESCSTRTGNQGGLFKTNVKFASKPGARAHFKLAGPAPVSQAPRPIDGIGLKLLQNMGWKPGEGLGKDKSGVTEPLLLEQKTDKFGLYTREDNIQHLVKGPPANVPRKQKVEITFEGKHPVSQLSELAARYKWKAPEYEISELKESKFHFRITINDTKYESTVEAVKKKDAKLFAAQYVLKALAPVIEALAEAAAAEQAKNSTSSSPPN